LVLNSILATIAANQPIPGTRDRRSVERMGISPTQARPTLRALRDPSVAATDLIIGLHPNRRLDRASTSKASSVRSATSDSEPRLGSNPGGKKYKVMAPASSLAI